MSDNKSPEKESGGEWMWHIVLGFILPGMLSAVFFLRDQQREEQERVEARQERFRDSAREMEQLAQSVRDGTASQSAQWLMGVKKPTPPIRTEKWVRPELAGHTYKLIDETIVRILSFADTGEVAACIGQTDGRLTHPSYRWKIDDLGAVDVTEPDGGRVVFRLLKVRADGDRYEVVRSLEREHYIRIKY